MSLYLPSVEHANRELIRLTGIRNNIAGLVVELETSNHKAAATWIKIYNQRLKENVLPAIAEVRNYLLQQAK